MHDGPLSRRCLRAFDADGFVRIDNAIDSNVAQRCLQEAADLCADPAVSRDERVVRQHDTDEVRSLFAVHELSPRIRNIAVSGLAGYARQVLGSPVYIHQSRVNFKPGFGGGDFFWHSDFETWHAEDGLPAPRAVTVAVALTDNLAINGPLLIVPGSHRHFIPCRGDTPTDFHTESLTTLRPSAGLPDERHVAELVSRNGIYECTMPPGSAVMFDANALHGSGNNITPLPRATMFVVFNSTRNLPAAPYGAARMRPPFLAGRDYTPV